MSKILENIAVVPAHSSNHGGYRTPATIKYIVVHYTGNDGDHDTGNANYYAEPNRGASAHYFVDDDSITRSVQDHWIAWAVGGEKWKDCAQTGGGSLYGVATNTNSISVEMCDTQKNGTYDVTEKTMSNTIELIKMLMDKYNIPIERVIRHFDVTGKHCPAYFMDESAWAAFKARLVDAPVEARYNTMAEISDNASWAIETVSKLIERGAIRGGGKRDLQGRPADMDLSRDMLRLLVIADRAGTFEG